MLWIRSTGIHVAGRRLSDPVSIDVPLGEIHRLEGPNGCGKSLLLDQVCGLVRADNIRCELAGESLPRTAFGRWRAGLRRLFQFPAMAPGLTVSRAVRGASNDQGGLEWCKPVLSAVELEPGSRLGKGSFGQKRAVEFLAALHSGRGILLDEPFAGMHEQVLPSMKAVISYRAAQGVAFLVVDHSGDSAPDLYKETHPFPVPPMPRPENVRELEVPRKAVPDHHRWRIRSLKVPGRVLARDLTIELPPGSLCLLRGANGSGKTTLLRCLADLPPAFDGVSAVVEHQGDSHSVGYWPQPPKLIQDFSARKNLGLMAQAQRWTSFSTPGWARQLLTLFGLDARDLDNRAEVLSGGEASAVALVGAAMSPLPVLLIDEPFASFSLDATEMGWNLVGSMLDSGRSLILATHHDAPPDISGRSITVNLSH